MTKRSPQAFQSLNSMLPLQRVSVCFGTTALRRYMRFRVMVWAAPLKFFTSTLCSASAVTFTARLLSPTCKTAVEAISFVPSENCALTTISPVGLSNSKTSWSYSPQPSSHPHLVGIFPHPFRSKVLPPAVNVHVMSLVITVAWAERAKSAADKILNSFLMIFII